METVTLDVQGMMCGGCSGRVERALKAVDGVSDASADASTDSAKATFDPAKTNVAALKAAIVEEGFEA